MNPNVFSVNKSLSRDDIGKLGSLRILGHTSRYILGPTLRYIYYETQGRFNGNTILCEGLVGVRETMATTSSTSVSIHETPLCINREGMMSEIKIINCRLGVMFVVVNRRLDFFYFAVDQSLTKDTPYYKFKDDFKYENFKSIEDAMEAYSVYELVEEL